jgi:hypothetical protein
MTTPNDQNFEAFPVDISGIGVIGANTLGSFVFEGHRIDPGGTGDISTAVIDSAATGLSIGAGKALALNYGYLFTTDWWQFRSVSALDNFKMASMAIESADGGFDNVVTVSGYNDGALVVSATVDLTASGGYGSIGYARIGGAVGGTLSFGAGWGNVDTVRFFSTAGDPYGTELWIDNIDVSAAVAITSAAYDAASGVLTVAASGVSAGESITAAKLTLTGQGGNSYALTSGAVTAGAGSFSIALNAADKLAVNGLLNKNLGAADDGTVFNLAAAAGWNSSSGAEVDGTSPVSVSNVTTPSISSATYNAATHVLSVTGANLVGTVGGANDVVVAKLSLTGEGGATYALTGADVDVANASGFAVTLSGTDRAQVEMMFNRNGTLATDGGTAYNLSATDNWNTSYTGGNTAVATTAVTVSNVATPTISSASYDAATGVLVVTGSGLTHAAGAANDIVASKLTFTGQGGATYTLTNTANADIASGTSFTLVLSAADRSAVDLLLNKNGAQSNGGTTYNLAMGEDWAAGAAAAVVVADASGNAITVRNVVADTTPPTATLGLSDSALKIGDTALVTITFSEAVAGFTNADLAVANGTLGAVASSDGGVTWSATFTPAAGVTAATNAITLDKTGVNDAAGNAGVGTVSSASYAIDTLAPTAAIVLSDSALSAGESATVTLTFSESVAGLTLADLSAGAGALSALSSVDGGVTWSATLTPSVATTSAANAVTLAGGSLTDLAGNANAGATSSANYAVDTLRPSASVTLSDSALAIGETATVTIAFSEAVTGFSNADLTLANGVLTTLASNDGGVTWTATFTPHAGVTDASNVIALDQAASFTPAGNAGIGAASSANFAIDTARPTATVAMNDSALSIGETASVTIAFSEAVSGFTNADLAIANGTLGAVASSDGGVTWSATFTPAAGITAATNVITLDKTGVSDAAGNAGVGSASSANYTIDTAAPTAAIVLSDSALSAGESATVTITFSESVAGLTLADLSAGAATLGGLASLDGGVTWSATLTPHAATASAANLITLAANSIADLAGNPNAGVVSSANYTVDTVLASATVTLSDSFLKAGETSLVTIVFTQAVSGFSNADLTVANGVLTAVASSDGGVTWSATFTPNAGVTAATNIITLDNTGVTTGAGNPGVGVTNSANYAIDTLRPIATVSLDDNALKIGDAATLTVTFSDAVSGFTNADLAIANGTLGAVASSDGGVTWSATFTPAAGVTDAANVITVDTSGVTDAAGNAGVGSTSSANYTIDTAAPTAAIVLSDSALIAGESATVTLTFSESVAGLTLADLSAGAGTLGGLASLDGGVTWSATLTPDAATASAANLITLAANSITDLAGNANAGTASSASYSVQTVRPTASVSLSDSALNIGGTSIVTIVFSSAVGGLSNADLTVANGVLAPVVSSDGGVTWSATFTPNAGVTAAANTITLDNAGVTNGAGNAGSGATSSANYAIDTVRPSATITLSDRTLAMGETAIVTITFPEAVSGLTNDDLVVEYGTLDALASNDGGVTWRATFTPDAATRATGAVNLATSGVQDQAGNAGDTQAVSGTYAIDTWVLADHHDANIDGAPATSVTVIDPATGLAMVTLTVPVTLAFDPAPSLGKPGVADIELGIGPTGLVVRLPLGAGLVAEGPATLLALAQATTDLIARIDNATDAGSGERQEMRAQAHGFLDGLLGGALLETRTLILSSGTVFPAGAAIEVAGSAGGSSHPGAIGLVIDTGALRPDIVLQIDNVDFAAIIGAATIRGGAGRNQLVGNHLAQNFSLGEGDDFGAGGGGNDLLAGGLGNDVLLGGLGDDVLQGGRSDRGDWTFVVDPAGALVARHALAAFEPGALETVAAAELNPAAPGLGFIGAKAGQLVELALLYDAAFGRAPDLDGLAFYARGYSTAQAVMQSFLGSSEWLAAANEALGDSGFLVKMYQQVLHRGPDTAGFAFWLDALSGKNGAPLARADFLTQFALSPEHRSLLAGSSGDIVVGAGAQAREGDWFAHSGDDRLSGGPGNDVIVGGDGVDTLVYSGKLDDYRFLMGRDGQLRVEDKASGEIDTISGIEKGEFSDGTVKLSFTQADPKALQGVALTYQLVLDRAADADGFAFWLGAHDDPTHMASMFVESAEFTRRYGTLDDAHFVATLLANSGVASTGGLAAGWESWLGTHSRAELVVALIGDPAVTNVQFGAQGLWLV